MRIKEAIAKLRFCRVSQQPLKHLAREYLMTPMEIILLIATLAFIVLVGFAVYLIVVACGTLKALQRQIDSLEMQHVNAMAANVNQKLKCLDPIFQTVSNIGERWECSSAKSKDALALKYLQEKLEKEERSQMDNISDVVDLTLKSIALWQKFKNRS